mgnify:CR=1 FL=1
MAVGGDSVDGVAGETTVGGVGVTTVVEVVGVTTLVETGGGVVGIGDGTDDGAGRGGVAGAFVDVRVAAERFTIVGSGGWGR